MIHPLNRNQFALGGVIGFFLLLNLSLLVVLSKFLWEIQLWAFLSYFFGIFLAQICLLGIWAGLGMQPAKWRFPLTGVLAVLCYMAVIAGCRMAIMVELDPALSRLFFLFGLASLLTTCLVSCILRFILRRRIVRPATLSYPQLPSDNQITLRYVFIWMTVLAVMLLLLKQFFQPGNDRSYATWEWKDLLISANVITLICLSCVPVMLLEQRRFRWLFGVLTAVFVPTWLLGHWDLLFDAVICFTMFAALFVVRRLGYRLVKLPRTTDTPQTEPLPASVAEPLP